MTNHPLCVVDQRPVHTDGQLCAACWADLEHDLAELPELVGDLERVLAGLTRTGGSPIGIVVRTAERGIGFNEAAGDLLRELHNTLGGWVRVLFEDEIPLRPACSLCNVVPKRHALGPMPVEQDWPLQKPPLDVRDDTSDLARWLGEHGPEIRRHEAVGELWSEIRGLAERARKLVTPRPPKVYLGMCSTPFDESDDPELCDADLYADEGRRGISCPQCGAYHPISQRREVLLGAVADQLATAVEASRALTAMTGAEVSVNTIRSWAHRGKLAQHPPRDGERSPRYRVGDIEQLLVRPSEGHPIPVATEQKQAG